MNNSEKPEKRGENPEKAAGNKEEPEHPLKGEFGRERSRNYRDDRPPGKNTEESDRKKPYSRDERQSDKPEDREKRPYSTGRSDKPEYRKTRPYSRDERRSDKPENREKRPYSTGRSDKPEFRKTRPYSRDERRSDKPEDRERRPWSDGRPEKRKSPVKKQVSEPGLIRLNKYIANAGICSRREADELITAGAMSVNGVVVTKLGTKISPSDKVQYGDQTLNREKFRYVLLNKPKGFITTTDDPQERKTVMRLVEKACKERIYPVGRLDRNTTGLLLFTNDGELAKKLSHPKHGTRKVYHVVLDKPLTKKEIMMIAEGIELDDGVIKVDAIEYSGDGKDKKEIGIELHSGKNRIVRRIFEKLMIKVVRLDRVAFAGLTKKNLPRGEWRHLDEKEVSFLKMLS